jgi:hypothetical protein
MPTTANTGQEVLMWRQAAILGTGGNPVQVYRITTRIIFNYPRSTGADS